MDKEYANKVFPENTTKKDKTYVDMEAETMEFISSAIGGFNVAKGDMNSGLGYKPNTLYCFGNSLKGKHCNICRDKLVCKNYTIYDLIKDPFLKDKVINSFVYEGLVNDDAKEDNI